MKRLAEVLFLVIVLSWGGCASLGCDVDPLKPKKALRCEIPLG